jgi:hypothetical protein
MISIMFDVQQGKWFKVNFSIYQISFGVAELKKYLCSKELSPYLSLFVQLLCRTLQRLKGDGTSIHRSEDHATSQIFNYVHDNERPVGTLLNPIIAIGLYKKIT